MLHLQAKAPGDELATQARRPRGVRTSKVFGRRAEAYQRLLEDAMDGDPRRFGRADALEEQWRIVDPVVDQPAAGRASTTRARGARPRPTASPPTSAAGASRSRPANTRTG